MKELSVEEKVKAYDKIVDRAKKELNACGSQNYDAARQIFRLFPELKESVDERIMKSLKILLQHFCNGYRVPGLDFPVSYKDMLAWLEKQELLTKEKALKNSPFVEQKPADLPKGEDYGIDGLYAAIDILQKTLGEVDGYQSDDGILEHKCAISAVKELSKQQNNTWSEEDERTYKSVLYAFEHNYPLNSEQQKFVKSFKNRYFWKPSKGQLECLGYAIEKAEKDWSPLTNNRIYLTLKALKEQLLELRGSKV